MGGSCCPEGFICGFWVGCFFLRIGCFPFLPWFVSSFLLLCLGCLACWRLCIRTGDLGLPRGAAQVAGMMLASTVGAACSCFLFPLVQGKAVRGVVGATANPTPGRERAAPLVVVPPLTPVAPQWLWNERPDSIAPPRGEVNEFRDFSLKEHRDLLGLHSCPGLHPHGLAEVVQPGQETESKLLGEATYYSLLQ